MNMLPIYVTDFFSLAYLTLLSFLMNAVPNIEVTPEMWRLQREATTWIFWRMFGA
jgi:hypothetical protein